MKTKNGFSLLEIIVAIGIIGMIGAITVTILTRTYRSSSQSDLFGTLKQNGQIASVAMEDVIRPAEAIICYGVNPNGTGKNDRIVVRGQDGKYTKFRFVDPVNQQNGYIVKQVNLNDADFNTFCTSVPNTAQELPITDRNVDSGVSITNGEFIKLSGAGSKDTVTIKFDVRPGARVVDQTTVHIQTTVKVR